MYVKGQYIGAGVMFAATVLALALRALLSWENKNLDRKQEASDDINATAVENYGPGFRYVL